MNEDAKGWSCYITSPAEMLEIFEGARRRCPVAHSDEHDGFYMLLDYADVRGATGDHKKFSSEPQVLRPMLPRKPIPALEMDWHAILAKEITAQLAFGFGIHTCSGAAVARLESKVVLEELLRRMPDIRLAINTPDYQLGGGDYCFIPSLPITFTPGRVESARQ